MTYVTVYFESSHLSSSASISSSLGVNISKSWNKFHKRIHVQSENETLFD